MKKIITFVIAAAMIAAMLTVAAGAQSIAPNGSGWDGDPVTVKKADPSAVVKDGIISDGEYEQYFPNLSDEESPLQVVYINGDNLDSGFALLATMQYFFSWDEVHGFNFAVRGKPDAIQQLLGVKEGDKPEDDFLHNVGWGISAETDNDASPTLYFALAKRTDNGEYLEGHWKQLGAQANYDPTPVQDYEIAYDYGTGYCTIEWSIPLNNFFTAGGGAGSTIKATIWMCAGMTTEADDYSDFYGVSLGDFGYAVNVKSMINHVTYNLVDEELAGFENPFEDVAEGDYFFAPVMWAVKNNVTQGVKPTMFAPSKTCTREQVVTFLWRAKGSPEPTSSENPFKDVKEGDYFYKAVLWAVENEITQGISKTEFGTGKPCTRAQVVTFLWRTEGKPTHGTSPSPFSDVNEGDYYFSAVLWAVENEITQGVKPTKFAPGDACTRGQIVTFLHRDFVSA